MTTAATKKQPAAEARRHVDVPFRLTKSLDDTDPDYFQFEGYGSTFGDVDWYGDTVMPGAFKQSLMQKMPKLLYQHDMAQPVGVIDDAREDMQGLYIKGRMPKTLKTAQDIMALVKCGAIDSFSIGFNTVDSEYREDGGRLLKAIDLWEVSFVTIPANSRALITDVKSLSVDDVKAQVKTKRDFERLLRESGLFSKDASVFLASGYTPSQGEPADDDVTTQKPEVRSAFDKLILDLNQLRSETNAGQSDH